MAIKHAGNEAPYHRDTECRYCTGAGSGRLSSKDFGSCVGLVLYGERHRIGVVAHYSGSLGHPTLHAKARQDTQQILLDVCPVLPGIWKAWVFGGISLYPNKDHETATIGQTKTLIDLIRDELRTNRYIPVNSVRKSLTEPEMQDGIYVGHKSVTINIETGAVTFPDEAKKVRKGSF